MISLKELEEHLVLIGEWRNAPSSALRLVNDLECEYGGDIAIGQHPKIGWFVLHNQGIGPGLVWQEYEL
jgi:hypothetical protein